MIRKIECDECHDPFDKAMRTRIAGRDQILHDEDCLWDFIKDHAEEVVEEHMDYLLDYYEQKAEYIDCREDADL